MILLSAISSFAQSSENQQIVFEGSLTDSAGNPIDLSGASLKFYVSTNGCYLYGENSSTSGDSTGNIVHRIGAGTQVAGSPNSFSQNLFFGSVTGSTTFAGNDCSATAANTRLVQVYYADQNITATMKIGTVPYAQNATMLNGKSASDFVEVSPNTFTVFFGGSDGQVLTKSASGLTWTNSSATVTSAAVVAALGYTPLSNTAAASLTVRSNNLSDLTSATVARTNLGLGNLATKSLVDLNTDVSGILSTAHGGSLWVNSVNGIYSVSNTAIGTSNVLPTTKLYVEANSIGQVARFNNTSASGYGLRVDVAGTSSAQYALNVYSGLGSLFMVQNDGRLGVGTISPTARLHLAQAGSSSTAPLKLTAGPLQTTPTSGSIEYDGNNLYITDTSNTRRKITTALNENITTGGNLSTGGDVNVGGDINTSGTIYGNTLFANSIYGGSSAATNLILESTPHSTKGNIILAPNGGNVGIGTYSPNATLDVINPSASTGASTVLNLTRSSSDPADTSIISLQKSRGTQASPASVVTGDQLGQIKFNGYAGGSYNSAAIIEVSRASGGSGGVVPADFIFKTMNSSGSIAERMRLDQNGNLMVGTNSPTSKFNVVSNTAGSELARFDGGSTGYYTSYAANTVVKAMIGILNTGSMLFSSEISGALGIRANTAVQIGIGPDAVLTIANNKNVGIGVATPTSALTVSGSIRSISGGFEYPDGSSQTTSAFGGYERLTSNCSSSSSCSVTCTGGKKIISGGCSNAAAASTGAALLSSYPIADNQWQCQYTTTGSLTSITAWAVCTKM